MRNTFLTLDEARKMAPSIFTEKESDRCSSRYNFIPTVSVIEQMFDLGYGITSVMQAKVRKSTKEGFQRHLIRMRTKDAMDLAVKGSVPEIMLMNEHDGSSSFRIMRGAFRFACANGLIIANHLDSEVRINHSKVGAFEETVKQLSIEAENAARDLKVIDEWGNIQMSVSGMTDFALDCMKLRHDDLVQDDFKLLSYNARKVTKVRRQDDTSNDLFTFMNVVQENLLKGGYYYFNEDRKYSRVVRPVTSITTINDLNKDIWSRAARIADGSKALV